MTQAQIEASALPQLRRADVGRLWPLASAVFIAVVLGLAVYGKLVFPFLAGMTEKGDGSGEMIRNVPLPATLDWIVGVFEIGLIALVLSLHRKWATWALVTVVFAAFAGYSGQKLIAGEPCACFGDLEIFGFAMTGRITLGLDLVAIAIGLSLAARPRGKMLTSVGGLVTVLAGAAAIGAGFSALTAPPAQGTPVASNIVGDGDVDNADDSAPRNSIDVLMEQPMMSDVVSAGPDDPVWLVYIYSEQCPTCQEHLRYMRDYQERRPSDPLLRIRTVSMQRLEADLNLPIWSWPSVPTLIRVERGRITQQYEVDALPTADEVRADLMPDTDPLTQLKEISKLEEVFEDAEGGPTYLLYLYNPECQLCIEHLAKFRAYEKQHGEDNPLVRVRSISMFEIENRLGIPLYRWPSVPFTARYEGGEMKQKYLADETPDPFRMLEEKSP